MAVSEADVIAAVRAYTYLSCQTSAENSASTNTEANLLYTSSSENQGNFSLFYDLAEVQVAQDETLYADTFSDVEKAVAYAHLIQHYYESKFKDWDAEEINLSNDIVKKPIQQTSGWAAYQQFLKQVFRTVSTADRSTEIENTEHSDSLNFPDDWKNDQLDVDVITLEA